MAAKKKASAAPPPLDPGKKKPGRKLVPGDPSLDHAELEAITAVKEFEVAEKVIDMFKIENSAVLRTYEELLDEREQKRQVADAAIRQCDASFGRWERFSEQKTYFPTSLYELVGEEKFLELGGRLGSTPTYEIEKEKIELAIAAHKIPEEIIPEIRKIVPKYRAPK